MVTISEISNIKEGRIWVMPLEHPEWKHLRDLDELRPLTPAELASVEKSKHLCRECSKIANCDTADYGVQDCRPVCDKFNPSGRRKRGNGSSINSWKAGQSKVRMAQVCMVIPTLNALLILGGAR